MASGRVSHAHATFRFRGSIVAGPRGTARLQPGHRKLPAFAQGEKCRGGLVVWFSLNSSMGLVAEWWETWEGAFQELKEKEPRARALAWELSLFVSRPPRTTVTFGVGLGHPPLRKVSCYHGPCKRPLHSWSAGLFPLAAHERQALRRIWAMAAHPWLLQAVGDLPTLLAPNAPLLGGQQTEPLS